MAQDEHLHLQRKKDYGRLLATLERKKIKTESMLTT